MMRIAWKSAQFYRGHAPKVFDLEIVAYNDLGCPLQIQTNHKCNT